MFSVFHKEDGQFKFRGVLANKKDDVFVAGSLKTMGWNKADVKLYCYDDVPECEEFFKHFASRDKKEVLFAYEDGKLEMCKVTVEKAETYGNVSYDNPAAIDIYTPEQITQLQENKEAIDTYIAANPEATEIPDGIKPHAIEEYVGIYVSQKEQREVIKTIQGILVDIDAKIATETTPTE